ncbi:hypothetical protein P3X46_015840 [Hevea brasiliensis]|uniref:NUC153 domain-containing protein n=1 Tax=Hevea brasiliensis TaxID=3981 RepID=A0ABQ9LZM5_HEVBR|nr:pre-rRNA-processing protein esf1 [Hevea brasiliensis]KAJ9172625.1 hypothetical protein P3X46_015840 [Hevea brasiliensis]
MGSKSADHIRKKKKNKPKKDSDAKNSDKIHHGGGGGRKIIADPRFASVHSDPRFQKVPTQKSKVAIDSRFNRIFTDKNFASSSALLDKRGKPKKHKSESSLRHYYRIQEEEEKDNDDEREETEKETKIVSDEDDGGEEVGEESEKEELEKLDLVAEESDSISQTEGSESEGEAESTTDEEDEEMLYEDDLPEVEVENIPSIEDGTRRLAVVNMDWRHVRAVDLYVILCSFLPKGGEILSVSVYPSEFGLQRMKEEELHGPVGLFDDENKDGDDGDDDDEIDEEKLRAYERSRLRYYYGVVECDSVSTAEQLYKACDGLEFERSSNVLDLRFVPDSMEFKNPPRDVATEAPASYEGLDFHTKALQHSSVPISWDEDEPQRVKTLKRKFNADQLAELELKEFLASDESESDEDENDAAIAEGESDKKHKKLDKYRALIQSGDGSDVENEDEGQDMEITFNTGLEDISKHILKKRDKKSESVWEAHLREKREKKKARKKRSKYSSEDESSDADEEIEEPDDFFVEEPAVKKGKKDARAKSDKEGKQLQYTDKEAEASRAELELLLADDSGANNGVKGYNLKHKTAKGKREKEVPDENKLPNVDYDDPRFSALFNSHLFSLDPTDPQFKRSAAYARQMARRQQKGDQLELGEGEHKKQPTKSQLLSDEPVANKNEQRSADVLPSKKEKHEISSLVKSLKMKSKQLQLPSNGNTRKDEKLQPRGAKEMEKPELATLVQSVKKKAKAVQK